METEVEQCSVDKRYFEIQKKELLIENERLFEKIISQDFVCIAMHSCDDLVKYAEIEQSYIDEYNTCVKREAELSKTKDMVEKDVFNEISNRCSRLEKRCISLEIKVQQSKESFQHDKLCTNQDALEFLASFEINDLKVQLQAKNTSIIKLKENIATLKGESVSDCIAYVQNENVIALGMFKLDLEPLSLKLRKNREAHIDYLKQTKEHDDTLCEIVKQARAFKALDNNLDYASKSGKSNKKTEWKPTGKVFTNVGHKWLPTGMTFTIDGNKFPVTRITSTTVVPPKKPSQTKEIKKTLPHRESQGKPNATKNVGSSSKPKIVESMISNNLKPNKN
ncbi:hypothetical protein Tco_0544135 [Tanacetum coccineum]